MAAIKKAYAAKLKHTKPQDDAHAYQCLRQAYEAALVHARTADSSTEQVERRDMDVANATNGQNSAQATFAMPRFNQTSLSTKERPVPFANNHMRYRMATSPPKPAHALQAHRDAEADPAGAQAPSTRMTHAEPLAPPPLAHGNASARTQSPDEWMALLEKLIAGNEGTALDGQTLMSSLQCMGLADQHHMADLVLQRVLVNLDVLTHQLHTVPEPLLPLLDQHFGWSRDIRWRRSVDRLHSERLMLVLSQAASAQQSKLTGKGKERNPGHHHQPAPPFILPEQKDDQANAHPSGWDSIATLLKRQVKTQAAVLTGWLMVVLALGFPLFTRPGLLTEVAGFKPWMGAAFLFHALGWSCAIAFLAGCVGGMTWTEAWLLAGGGYLYCGVMYALLFWPLKGEWRQRVTKAGLLRWCEKPWRAWTLLLTPCVFAALLIHAEITLAVVAFLFLPFATAFQAMSQPGWRIRPSLFWCCVLCGVGLLIASLNEPMASETGLAYMPVLVALPFVMGLTALAVFGKSIRIAYRSQVLVLVLALLFVNLELAITAHLSARPLTSYTLCTINAMAVAAGLLPWLLWTNSLRYSSSFFITSLIATKVLLFTYVDARPIDLPYLTIALLCLLLVTGTQHLMDRAAVAIARRIIRRP